MAVLERARAHAPRTPSAQGAGLVLALTATVVWSGNFVIARALHDTVPPVQTAFWRWIIALLAVAPLALPQVRRQWPVIRRHLGFPVAGYSALLRHRPEGIGGVAFLFMTFALGAAMLLPAYGVSLAAEGGFAPTAGTVGPLLYIGICSSAVAYFTWNKAIALVGAARAGVVYYLQPVCVALLSHMVLGEAVGPVQLVCTALIVVGVALGAGSRR
ncbi:DMT family transporter [Streptomyces lydicus]|uniref:DMT family transporter n=1 Tax=Streptomyces lydicus TaxID=47763 RepID=UPI003788BBF6